MKFLIFSILIIGVGCASEYKGMQSAAVGQDCLDKVRPPALETSWYTASIDVVGKHLSGLLLLKQMPDNSRRVVFTNEAGVTFFDFAFMPEHGFKVHQIMRQLNRKAVVQLLRKDFELLLGVPFESSVWQTWKLKDENFIGVIEKNDRHYLVTDSACSDLVRLESASARKKKLTIIMYGMDRQLPDSISLQHHTFAMRINLKHLEK